MQIRLGKLAAVLLLLGFTGCTTASPPAHPSAAAIETLLRDRLASDDFQLPGMIGYKKAVLVEFGLARLERLTADRWHADVGLLFNFGPPPAQVLGFERSRLGHFRLVLKGEGDALELLRFTPVVKLRKLPGEA